jgi:hypothetical protein
MTVVEAPGLSFERTLTLDGEVLATAEDETELALTFERLRELARGGSRGS